MEKRKGRHRKENGRKVTGIRIRLSDEDKERLKMLSEYEELSMSDVIRRLVNENFEQNRNAIIRKNLFSE